MGKLYFEFRLKTALVTIFSIFMFVNVGLSQCPTIQFVDLRGTPGFPQTDNLNVCGAPDTLSILMFTDAPGQVKGFEFTVNMVSGMRYAGFEEAHYGGCTDLSNTDPDVNSPSFVGAGLTCGDIFVANIGVTADCSVDLVANDYTIEIDYSYTYFPPTGGSIKCKGTEILDNDFNGAIKEAVLNMFTPSPIDVTVASLGAPYCQSFTVSQDGLQAYVSEFEFAVCGIDLDPAGPISVTSMTANGSDIFGGAVYNPADTSLTTTVDASIFPANGSTNPNGTADQFDTNEKVTIEVCYEVANCPDGADIPFTYKAWYGCFDEVCQITGKASFLKVRPSGSLPPVITASLDNGIQICGDDAKVSASVTNPNTDTDQNAYTDLSIGFQACGMEALDITSVMINGVDVSPTYMLVGGDIDIDLSMNTDPSIGLVDYDGDGFFDDLPGGAAPLDVMITFAIGCGIGVDGGCPEINCDNVQFYVKGKTNCGNAFQAFPSTGGFDLQYGQESSGHVGEEDFNTAGTVVGYDFGKYSNDGAPVGTGSSEVEIEFCYEFAQANIEDCPSGGDTKLVGYFGGPQFVIEDLEVVPGSVMIDDGSGYAAVPDADAVWTLTTPATATLEINQGNNNPTLCYKYKLKLDDCSCGPVQYVAVDHQIVSVCSDCTPDCTIVKGCGSTLLKMDPECSPCPCMAQYNEVKTERKNLGYIDKEMSRKITRDELLAANAVDLGRFMPGDTLWHQGYWELNEEDMLFSDPMRWVFAWRCQTIAGSGTSGEVQAALPLTWEGGSITLNELRIENPDGSIHFADMSALANCMPGGAVPTFNSFDTHFNTPGADGPGSTFQCAYSAWEGYDGNYTQFDMWNFDRMEEVNSVNSSIAKRHHYGEGDCVSEFIDTYEIVVGSKIHFDWCVPLIKNPLREMAKILGVAPPEQNVARIVPLFYAYNADEIAGTSTYGMAPLNAGCAVNSLYNISCPGGLKSETNITLDACGGTIEHEFVVEAFAGVPGDEWFTHEYRPLVEIYDLELPIYSPLAYCANAIVEQNGISTPVTVDSTMNMKCSPVAGYSDDLCSVDSGSEGAIVIDLYNQGFQGLGIGLGNCDTLRLSYDYCTVCPAPLNGVLDYQLKADWCYKGGQPNECAISSMTFYGNGTTIAASATLVDEAQAAGFAAVHNGNYYNLFNMDTLYCKEDDVQGTVFVMPDPLPPGQTPVSTTNQGGDLIAAASAGTSVEAQEIEFCNPDAMDATGFSTYVTVPNPVSFMGVCTNPDDPATALTTTLISDDGQLKKYLVEMPATTLAPGECVTMYVKTTLLYCPTPGSLPPEICVGGSSGCSPDAVRAAIGSGGGSCASSEICYAYIFGEAGIQTEWFSMPENPKLCEPMTLHVRTKNVKDLLLLGVDPNFTLPFGMTLVPNSWEIAYPGGAVDMTGNFGAWTPIDDPDDINGLNYGWLDEATWSSYIDENGLKGVTSGLDSNNVAFRFQVTTNCDEFLSGSKPRTETMATDPCGPDNLSSGDVESPAIIIDGADPADYAQILAVGSPSELYCGGLSNQFGLTALNVSDKSTTDSVVTCLTIPGDVMDYVSGSVMFTNGFMPDWLTETPIGDDIMVCFHSPALAPGAAWSVTFEAAMREDAPCGEIEIGADIKSVVEAVTCVPGPPDECDVFVQNSLNPIILIDLKPPLETTEVRASMDCTDGEDPVQVCYEIDLSNPGPAYNGNVRVGIHDDVTANGVLESFDTELNGMDHAVSLAPGETTTLTMCLEIDAIQACPIIIKQTYETDCACDSEETPIMDLSPSFIADLEECTVLCPTQPLTLETCGDYEITLEPAEGGTLTDDGTGVLTVELNEGFGVVGADPVKLVVTGTTGECEIMDMVELKSLGDWLPEDQVADICEDDCVDLDLQIPDEFVDGATITWTPEIGLDDPTSATPEVCGLTADQVYNVEIRFNDDCAFNVEYTVTYNPNGETTITGEPFCACYELGTIEGLPGFESYEWYSIQSGAEILEAITTTNVWNGPAVGGDYILKAYLPGALCPNVSNVLTLETKECVDLELEKNIINIPSPLTFGSQITYEIIVCNIADDSLGLKFDATGVEISDELPGAVSYVSHTHTTGNYSPNDNQWDISILESGTCDTLLVDVTLEGYGPIVNEAQISASDNEDIDSEENNDDGDQSEDDEDLEEIMIDTFDVALRKMLNPMQTVPVTIGSTVTYDIEVCNQGTIDAYNVEVVDYVPAGMMVTDPNWTVGSVANEYFFTVAGPITPGMCEVIQLTTTITALPVAPETSYTNYAEISMAEDVNGNNPPDIDSMPDNDPDNDGPVEDDKNDNTNGDEDDHDPAVIAVVMVDCMISSNTAVCPGMPIMAEEIGEGNTAWSWSGPAGFTSTDKAITIDPAVAGTYTVTVTDANGLTSSCEAELEIHPEMILTADITNVSCGGESSGAINFNVEGGTLPLAYDWSTDGPDNPDDDEQDLTEMPAGDYSVTVTDANGCVAEAMFTITEPDVLACSTIAEATETCALNDGMIEVAGTGGTTPYSYSIDGGTTSQAAGLFDELTAGEYTITITDADDCVVECEFILEATCFDLALVKTTLSSGPFAVGMNVIHEIEVINQGNIDATNVEVIDHLPCGFEFDPGLLTNFVNGWGGPVTSPLTTIPSIPAGMSVKVPIEVTIIDCGGPDAYTNQAEISKAFDGDGEPGEDVDSDPDYDPDNDAGGDPDGDSDNQEDGDGTDDEDDHDPEKIVVCEEIAGEVFYDDDHDGCKDPSTDAPVEGAIAYVFSCGETDLSPENALGTDTTDVNGEYAFGVQENDGANVCLDRDSSYFVLFELPNSVGEELEGYDFTHGDGEDCNNSESADDTDPNTGMTDCYNPDGDDNDDDINAGITRCEEVAGTVFYDWNEDGCQDAQDDGGAEGVVAYIYSCGEDNPTPENALASDTTDVNGDYAFGSMEEGTADICLHPDSSYFVVFDIPSAPGEALEGFEFTEGTSEDCAGEDNANDVDPATGQSDCYDPEDEEGPDPDTDADDGDQDIDAGITPPCEKISGEVFVDTNDDGCQQDTEMDMVEGAVASVFECDESGNPTGEPLAMDTTREDGSYYFAGFDPETGECLLDPEKTYTVVFSLPNAPGEAFEGYDFSSGEADEECVAAGQSDDVDPATGGSGCYDPNGDDDDDDIDAGISPPCESMGGEVFVDTNNDGCQSDTESTMVEGAVAMLFECDADGNATGEPLASDTTGADGAFVFGGIDPATGECLLDPDKEYSVQITPPNGPGEEFEGYDLSTGEADDECAAAGMSDDVDPGTGNSDCYDPSGKDDDDNIDAGIAPNCESMGGEVFVDVDNNGCQEDTESTMVEGAVAMLFECDADGNAVGAPLASDTTGADGQFVFGGFDPETGECLLDPDKEYSVQITPPNGPGEEFEGYDLSTGEADDECVAAGMSDDVDPGTGQSECYGPGDGDDDGGSDDDIDAGISPNCESMGGEVFVDTNNDGCQADTEMTMVEGAVAMLFECDADGNAVGEPLASDTTGADGAFVFGGFDPETGECLLDADKEYSVQITPPNGPGEAFEGYDLSTGEADDECAAAEMSDDVDPGTGQSECYGPGGDDGDGDGDDDIDAGITPMCESIGGEVFVDTNNDGCQSDTESTMVEGAVAMLFECDADGNATGEPLASDTTGADGQFVFGGIDPDTGECLLDPDKEYSVQITPPNGPGEEFEGYDLSTGEADDECAAAGMSDDVDPGTGMSDCYDPSGKDDDDNIDAGIAPNCESMGGEVFVDVDNNGCQEDTESTMVEGAVAMLFECDADGNAVGAPLASDTTGADGQFVFGGFDPETGECLLDPDKEYSVQITPPNGPGEAFEGYDLSAGEADDECVAAGMSDDVDPGTGQSECYGPGDGDDDGGSDDDIDAGISPNCESMGGEVFVDTNNDGCQADTEMTMVEGAVAMLFECDADGNAVGEPLASDTTGADGAFVFGGFDPETGECLLDADKEYSVQITPPNGPGEAFEGYDLSTGEADDECAAAEMSDDVDSGTGQSECYGPGGDDGDGDSDDDIDAGITPMCESIGGEVFVDTNNDGCQSDTESTMVEGAVAMLFECDADGNATGEPLASDTTGADGQFVFGGIDPETGECLLDPDKEYSVQITPPNGPGEEFEGYDLSTGEADDECTAAGMSDDVDPGTGMSDCYDPSDDGDDDDGDDNIDAGIAPNCESMGGEVFVDIDNNGCQEDTESTMVEGAVAMLFECDADGNAVGAPLASDTTGADGQFVFGGFDPATGECLLDPDKEYSVQITPPNGPGEEFEGYDLSAGEADDECVAAGMSDDVDPGTGQSECYGPGDGDDDGGSDDDIDAGISPMCESIGGEVFVDVNNNGCQEDTEMDMVEGAVAMLFECDADGNAVGEPLASDTTGADGAFVFGGFDPETGECLLDADKEYSVQITPPNGPGEAFEGYDLSTGEADDECAAAEMSDDVDPGTGQSECYGPGGDDGDGDGDDDIDAGITPMCESIGGEVFVDTNNDGCQSDTESTMVAGAVAMLFECDADGNATGEPLASDTTGADGQFVFGGIDPETGECLLDPDKEYSVQITPPNGPGEEFEGYDLSTGEADDECAAAGMSSDVDPGTGMSDCYDPSDDGDDDDGDDNIDAGIAPNCESMGGEVFVDVNNDGCQADTEGAMVEGAVAMLFECDADGNAVGAPLASDTTGADGQFVFGGIDPETGECLLDPNKEYSVQITPPNGPGEEFEGYDLSSGEADDECAAAGMSDDVDPGTGQSECYGPGDDDGDGGDDDNIDAGISPMCESMGGEVFVDTNNDGCQADTEMTMVEGAVAMLFECDADGNAVGAPLASDTTGADGQFVFGGIDPETGECLLDGDKEYSVQITPPNGPGEAFEGYDLSTGEADDECAAAEMSDDVDPGTGQSECFGPGGDDGDGDGDDNIDAGITPMCESMGGEVFVDVNNDGCQSDTEMEMVAGAVAMLFECDADGNATGEPLASDTTGADGQFVFGGIDPATGECLLDPDKEYSIQITPPNGPGEAFEGYDLSTGEADDECVAAGMSSDVDPGTGGSECFDPSNDKDGDGNDDDHIDAGITSMCESMGGEVFVDTNNDGCQQDTEMSMVEGAIAMLFECDADGKATGAPLASDTTGADGAFVFGGIDPATGECLLDPNKQYSIQITPPNAPGEAFEGYDLSAGEGDEECAAAGMSDDVDPGTGQSECYDPSNDQDGDGNDDDHIDAGISPMCESMGGEVFVDTNNDGCQQDTEMSMVAGAVAMLFECDADGNATGGPLASDTTGADGAFVFGGIDPVTGECLLDPNKQYSVQITPPNGPGEAFEGYDLSTGEADASCAAAGMSSDVDPGTGGSECYDPSNDPDGDGNDDDHIDAGISPNCESMGGEVFVDANGSGCQESDEGQMVEGAVATLVECDASGNPTGAPVATDTTGADGAYVFGGFDPATGECLLDPNKTYAVQISLPNGPGEAFDGYQFTDGDGAGDDCPGGDSTDDVDPATGGTECGGPGDDGSNDLDAGIGVFDLALIKTIATPGPYETGDIIEFVISVVNQGGLTATDVNVVDHVPAGFSYDPLNNSGWTDTNAPTYNYTIAGPIAPGQTVTVSIFLELEYLEDQSDVNYTNTAEISGAKDGDGNPAVDIDSTPDSDPNNDGDPVDNSLDDKDDEDDHDPALLPLTGRLVPPCTVSCDVACIGQLNLSLGETCEATIVPSMLMPGLDSSCDDLDNAGYFEIVLTDQYGAPITGSGINSTHLGQLIQYSITVVNEDIMDPSVNCQNSCWGNILVESKFTPVLDCDMAIDTISCLELPTYVGPSLTGSGTGCFASEIKIEILNDQVLTVDPCEGDLVKKVIRQYQAVDVSGTRSNICTQELHVEKLIRDSIVMPLEFTQNLSCGESFLEIDTANLEAIPYYNPRTGSGLPSQAIGLFPLLESACNIFVEFEDEVILDQACKKQVLRTWNVRQWHCNEEINLTSVQLVTLVDTTGPVIVCPTDTIQVSTSGNNCTAKVMLPEISAIDSCQGDVAHIDMSFPGGFIENQNGGEVDGIPVGLHAVTYTAYDACHNSSSCAVYVNVVDERPPVIICERHTVVSIPTTGEAHVPADRFDDGSYDDCGKVILKVRRMDLSCQKSESDSTSIEFGDYAVFCCADAGSTHMVVLRAYEHSGTSSDTLGRFNECMVEVTVADKNPPSLVAPPDVTVSCDFVFDPTDLSIFGVIADSEFTRGPIVLEADSVNIGGSGFDGLSTGSCNIPIVETVNMGDVNSCGIGKITRTFTATSNNVTVTDAQMITVVSPVAFDSTRIMWPRDTVLFNTCTVASLHPDALLRGNDRPRIEDGVCELLGISITDEQIFQPVIGQDACFKLFRTWSVIDWCDTDENGYPARWDSIQTLGVENNLAPVISCPSTAEVYNSFDASCNPVMVNLVATATDECTPVDQLVWTWSIDLGRDGSIDTTGTGNEVSASYIPGEHQIVWYAEDLCGNVSQPCAQNFEITNEKAAPAICLDHVVTDLVLMDTDWDGAVDIEMVEVWVSDVVKEDSHPCGHALSYSFDQAGLQDSVVYGCLDKGLNEVKVWVTDLVNGAQSFCKTEIEVQDNNNIDLCGGVVHNPTSDGDVSGLILTEGGSQVSKVEVQMLGSEIPNAETDASGMYTFTSMPLGGDYTVVPGKDIEDINGVSTLDLVLIQKHILGIEIIDSPYKLLAADINKSNTISAADIVDLRKLILGEIDEYSNNTSWRFVDEEHEFADETNPWLSVIPEEYDIVDLTSDMAVDFVGVKVGDVSGNAKGDELVRAEVRSSKEALTFIGRVTKEGQDEVVSFSSSDFTEVSGYQMTVEYDASQYELLRIEGAALDLSKDNVGLRYASRGLATMSWHTEEAVSVSSEETLFRAYFRPKATGLKAIEISSSSKVTIQEAYIGGEITDRVEIELVREELSARMELNQNEPNPWRETTVIGFEIPEGGKVQVRLYDNTGKLIRTLEDTYGIGINEITIGRDIISTPGIYLYEVQYKDQIEHKRMIVLD